MIETLLLFFGKIKGFFSGQFSPYSVGDVVIARDGTGYPLLITEVKKLKNGNVLLYCRWYDRKTKETRYNFFHTDDVKSFDWQVQDQDQQPTP